MTGKQRPEFYYWDTSVFLALLNDEVERVRQIDGFLEELARQKGVRIITSTISIMEIHKYRKLPDGLSLEDVDKAIDSMWESREVEFYECTQSIMRAARPLRRGSVRAADAIHLATALAINANLGTVRRIHTFDQPWWDKYTGFMGDIIACEPNPEQLSIFPLLT